MCKRGGFLFLVFGPANVENFYFVCPGSYRPYTQPNHPALEMISTYPHRRLNTLNDFIAFLSLQHLPARLCCTERKICQAQEELLKKCIQKYRNYKLILLRFLKIINIKYQQKKKEIYN